MKIVLYFTEQTSFISKLVSFLSNSDITHASVINNGINYDTDLDKDAFTASTILHENPKRFCITYDLGSSVDCQEWIDDHIGTPYDLLGYFLWLFGRNPSKKMHCFDTVIESLKSVGVYVPRDINKRPTGTKLKNWLDSLGIKRTIEQCEEVN